jgi:hypothetical protein
MIKEQNKEAFVTKLLSICVTEKIISAADAHVLEQAFYDSDADEFDDFLLEEGIVDKDALLKALEYYYQVPSFDAGDYFFDRHLLKQFPKDVLLRNAIIPLETDETILVVVASDPSNTNLLLEIGHYVSYDIQFRVGLRREICDAVKEFYDKALTEDTVENIYGDPETPKTIIGEEFFEVEDDDESLLLDEDFDEGD